MSCSLLDEGDYAVILARGGEVGRAPRTSREQRQQVARKSINRQSHIPFVSATPAYASDVSIRVVRVYHAGRSAGHRARDRALVAAGAEVTLVVPRSWGESHADHQLANEAFSIIELPVVRPGDVNRHRYARSEDLAAVMRDISPDVVDVQEEPFSRVMRQVLSVTPEQTPIVGYTAQNLDKRYPPPFTRWERTAFNRISLIYPCSRQAAAVVRCRGFQGPVVVLPLGYDDAVFTPGEQDHSQELFRVALAGRLVPEKGLRDAIAAFAAITRVRRAVMSIAGDGPEAANVSSYCNEFHVPLEAIERHQWLDEAGVASLYQRSHLMLAPSLSTSRIVEQFGRMIPEAQACGCVVAAYATGAMPEVAAGGAWLAAEGDVVGLSRAATALALSADLWNQRREAGLAAAQDKTWGRVAARQVETYRLVTSSQSPAAGKAATWSAVGEFGAPARVHGIVARPFALPVLRNSRLAPSLVDLFDRRLS